MIRKIIAELRQFSGRNKAIFILSCIAHLRSILKDKTILTLKFIAPMKIETKYGAVMIKRYYEIPFHTYDYGQIIGKIKNDSLLFDIGAHFGEVTYRFLKEKEGFSYMFEANPNNSKVIREMLDKNDVKRYKLLEFGLGSGNKKAEIVLGNPLSYEGSILGEKGKRKRIDIKRLDGVNLPELKKYKNVFFKIDVEGYEVEVLKGMIGLLKNIQGKNVRFLIEVKGKENLERISRMLRGAFGKIKTEKITDEDYFFEYVPKMVVEK